MKLIEAIEQVSQWENIKHANPHLDFATMTLMAETVGFDVEPLGEFWRREYRDRCEVSPGLFKRAPKDVSDHCDYLHEYSFSHDEMLGLNWCSWRFDGGETAARVLDEGRFLGLYLSGKSPSKSIWDKYIDSEWFMFSPLRRVNMAYAKLACGRNLNTVEEASIGANLLATTAKSSYHLLDFKALWLKQMGVHSSFGAIKLARARIGLEYRERYGDNPIYKQLWTLRDAKSV